MKTDRFNIKDALVGGAVLLRFHAPYLSRLAVIPVAVTILCTWVALALKANPFLSAHFFIMLPAHVLTGFYLYHQARLLVTGELPVQTIVGNLASKRRREDVILSIGAWVLTVAVYALFRSIIYYASIHTPPDETSPASVFAMLATGVMIWAVRFIAAPILIAVGYPVKRYIYRVNGAGISFRFLAIFMVTMIPATFVIAVLKSFYVPDLAQATVFNLALLSLFSEPVWFAMVAWVNASLACALREMLRHDDMQPRRGGKA